MSEETKTLAHEPDSGLKGSPPIPEPTIREWKEGERVMYRTPKGWSEGRIANLNGDKVTIATVNAKRVVRTRKNVKLVDMTA